MGKTTPIPVGQQIRQARKAHGLSQAELALEIGTHQQTIEKIEVGKVQHSRFLAPILTRLKLDNVHSGSALSSSGNVPFTSRGNSLVGERNLPVFAAAEGGNGTMVLSSDPVDYVRRPAPLENVKDGYGVIVVGESMSPRYEQGDLLLVHPHLPPKPNTYVVLYSEQSDGTVLVTVKKLRKITSDLWHLTQLNPPSGKKADFTLPRSDWQRCHRIVGSYEDW